MDDVNAPACNVKGSIMIGRTGTSPPHDKMHPGPKVENDHSQIIAQYHQVEAVPQLTVQLPLFEHVLALARFALAFVFLESMHT